MEVLKACSSAVAFIHFDIFLIFFLYLHPVAKPKLCFCLYVVKYFQVFLICFSIYFDDFFGIKLIVNKRGGAGGVPHPLPYQSYIKKIQKMCV